MTPQNEFRQFLLKLLAEVRHREIQVLIDSDLFADATDLFDEDEVEEAVVDRANEDWPGLEDHD